MLQVSANPYVTSLGPPQTAASRLNLAQSINSLGTRIAPSFGAFMILEASGVKAVRAPYLGIAATLFVLALVFGIVRLPKLDTPGAARLAPKVWAHPRLRFGALAIFMYVGAEIGIGSMLVLFLVSTRSPRCPSSRTRRAIRARSSRSSTRCRRRAPPNVGTVSQDVPDTDVDETYLREMSLELGGRGAKARCVRIPANSEDPVLQLHNGLLGADLQLAPHTGNQAFIFVEEIEIE